MLRQWFEALDRNKTGRLGVDQLELPLMQVGACASRDELSYIMLERSKGLKSDDGSSHLGEPTLDWLGYEVGCRHHETRNGRGLEILPVGRTLTLTLGSWSCSSRRRPISALLARKTCFCRWSSCC